MAGQPKAVRPFLNTLATRAELRVVTRMKGNTESSTKLRQPSGQVAFVMNRGCFQAQTDGAEGSHTRTVIRFLALEFAQNGLSTGTFSYPWTCRRPPRPREREPRVFVSSPSPGVVARHLEGPALHIVRPFDDVVTAIPFDILGVAAGCEGRGK